LLFTSGMWCAVFFYTADEEVIFSKNIDKERKVNLILNLSSLSSELSASSPWMMMRPCTHVCKESLAWSHS
jgi:hypothetical protein